MKFALAIIHFSSCLAWGSPLSELLNQRVNRGCARQILSGFRPNRLIVSLSERSASNTSRHGRALHLIRAIERQGVLAGLNGDTLFNVEYLPAPDGTRLGLVSEKHELSLHSNIILLEISEHSPELTVERIRSLGLTFSPRDILIVHNDLDLPEGTYAVNHHPLPTDEVKGNRPIQQLHKLLGGFSRLRVGTGRPKHRHLTGAYLNEPFEIKQGEAALSWSYLDYWLKQRNVQSALESLEVQNQISEKPLRAVFEGYVTGRLIEIVESQPFMRFFDNSFQGDLRGAFFKLLTEMDGLRDILNHRADELPLTSNQRREFIEWILAYREELHRYEVMPLSFETHPPFHFLKNSPPGYRKN